MDRLIVVALLVSLCSATSPPFPSVTSINCNETQSQMELAIDLINKERDDGFVFRPARVRSVFQQESTKLPGGVLYYMDLDVVETKCSVLSGKSWKECSDDISAHEIVFGHCKAIIFIAKPWRILKLVNYNCTLGTVPPSVIVRMCPDCPTLLTNINSEIEAKANLLIEKYNKESNQTHYFQVDEIERVRYQYVFGASYFFSFTIKETECLKTQADVILANCKTLKDHEAHVGFCTGSIWNSRDRTQQLQETCEIYEPRDDHDHDHGHRHGPCDHGPDRFKNEKGQDKSKAPGAEEPEVAQEGTGEAEDAPSNCGHKHGHCPPHRGGKHHRCRHDHHHRHPHHQHPHHHHHHHHHDHLNDSHPHDPSHHHHHHHHNHTSSKDGSSSEEHSDHQRFEKRSKGSVQFYYPSGDQSSVPVPTIVHLPPPPERPGKYGKPDNIIFPSEHSKLDTCPGAPLVDLPEMVKTYIFE